MLENIINDLKQELDKLVVVLSDDLNNKELQQDILAIITAINVLEVRCYGYVITDEWGL